MISEQKGVNPSEHFEFRNDSNGGEEAGEATLKEKNQTHKT